MRNPIFFPPGSPERKTKTGKKSPAPGPGRPAHAGRALGSARTARRRGNAPRRARGGTASPVSFSRATFLRRCGLHLASAARADALLFDQRPSSACCPPHGPRALQTTWRLPLLCKRTRVIIVRRPAWAGEGGGMGYREAATLARYHRPDARGIPDITGLGQGGSGLGRRGATLRGWRRHRQRQRQRQREEDGGIRGGGLPSKSPATSLSLALECEKVPRNAGTN